MHSYKIVHLYLYRADRRLFYLKRCCNRRFCANIDGFYHANPFCVGTKPLLIAIN